MPEDRDTKRMDLPPEFTADPPERRFDYLTDPGAPSDTVKQLSAGLRNAQAARHQREEARRAELQRPIAAVAPAVREESPPAPPTAIDPPPPIEAPSTPRRAHGVSVYSPWLLAILLIGGVAVGLFVAVALLKDRGQTTSAASMDAALSSATVTASTTPTSTTASTTAPTAASVTPAASSSIQPPATASSAGVHPPIHSSASAASTSSAPIETDWLKPK